MEVPKIAIVEDDYLLALVMSKFLTKKGYACSTFSNASDFFNHISEKNEFKALILDVKIKGDMNGIELFHLFAQTNNTPVIFATGSSDITEMISFDNRQVRGILIKPVQLDEIALLLEPIKK